NAAGACAPALAYSLARIQTLTPDSSANLDSFLKCYEAVGSYVMAPVVVGRGGKPRVGAPQLRKHSLHVRQAWEIGPHDPDCLAVKSDDEVLMPAGVVDPPVLRLRQWRAECDRGSG